VHFSILGPGVSFPHFISPLIEPEHHHHHPSRIRNEIEQASERFCFWHSYFIFYFYFPPLAFPSPFQHGIIFAQLVVFGWFGCVSIVRLIPISHSCPAAPVSRNRTRQTLGECGLFPVLKTHSIIFYFEKGGGGNNNILGIKRPWAS